MKSVFLASALLLAAVTAAEAEVLEVLSARVTGDPSNGSPGVAVRFSPASGEIIERLSKENIGRIVRIELNGRAVLSSKVTAPITNRYIFISNLGPDLADRLASDIMKAGSMEIIVPGPAPTR